MAEISLGSAFLHTDKESSKTPLRTDDPQKVKAQGLQCSSFFGQYIAIPKPKIGHNQKGTTLEPLGVLKNELQLEFSLRGHQNPGSESLGALGSDLLANSPVISLGIPFYFYYNIAIRNQ